MNMLLTIDQRRIIIASETSQEKKSELGQFMTPSNIARFMAQLFNPLGKQNIRLLDAGAGIGSLTGAFASRALIDKAKSLDIEAWEIDSVLHQPLKDTLEGCRDVFRDAKISFNFALNGGDFIIESPVPVFTHAILNPPYKKISSDSQHRKSLRLAGVETTNLYSAFVALALLSLKDGGELVAITPRSFCNGAYFKPFRKLLLEHSCLLRVHLFESRDHVFKGDDVLQENVIFHLAKGKAQGNVVISSSLNASFQNLTERTVSFSEVVMKGDSENIFHLVPSGEDPMIGAGIQVYTHTLKELGIDLSTGPVVDFRMRSHLRQDVEEGCAPLVYPFHFVNGFISHPKQGSKKPNGILDNEETSKWLMPSGNYVVVRRLTSKEEKRRIVPAVFSSEQVLGGRVGFENHLNVFHVNKSGLPLTVAKGLAVYLGSTLVDKWFRRFNGHTQVNAGDLRTMRYPDLETLVEWGGKIKDFLPSQIEIDLMVEGKFNVKD